jgi:hypothetical protein
MYTVRDIVEFVLKNRKGSLGFRDWDKSAIASSVINAMEKGTMIYSVDQHGMINAVMIGYVQDEDFRVVNILTTACGLGKRIVSKIHELFPECKTLTFSKRGRDRTYPLIQQHLKHLTN